MVRGATSGHYAHHVDVTTLGYASAPVNLLGVVPFAMVPASVYIVLDRLIVGVLGRRAGPAA
jgi:hypothetical protein